MFKKKEEKEVAVQMSLKPEKSRGRICESHSPADTKVRGKGIRGGASGAGAEISLQPIVQKMVKQLCPCNPWRTSGMERSTCSSWRKPEWIVA